MRTTRPKEIESVLRLDGPARFRHFVKRVADEERVWSLRTDGWALMADDNGTHVLPLWPAQEYADLCRVEDWSAYVAEAVELESLKRDLLPKLAEQGVLVGVFPTPGGKGVVVRPMELEAALREEEGHYG
jgi:hypothetical protein